MSLAPPQQTTVPTTSSPMTPINSAPQTVTTGTEPPAAPPPPEQPAAQIKPESTAAQAPSAIKFDEISAQLSDSKIPVEQRQQFAEQFVKNHVNANPDLMKGFQDIQAGNANTPEAQKYQTQLQGAQDEFIKQHVQQAVQNNPDAASNPQSFGAFASQAANNALQQFQAMPMPMQLMMGIGLPVGVVGLMSSLFGEGGMGAGLLGVLGLGAAGAAGAAGGVFGQGAQNMATDAAYQMGTFFGAVPEPGKIDLSAIKGEDALARLTKPMTAEEESAAFWNPEEKAKEVQQQLQQAETQKAQIQKFMMVPEAMRPRFLQNMDPTMSDEEAAIAARNINQLSAQFEDPESALSKKIQQGQAFVAKPSQYVRQKAWDRVTSAIPGVDAWANQGQGHPL
ncbi:MAG: hypothetical protein EBZ69_00985 [Alphaproteobacteria bacterium]|nr:hypothetical protein [Alphaproteobacteria bacterium]